MKHLILTLFIIFFFVGCEKDENDTTTISKTETVEMIPEGYDMPFGLTKKELEAEGWVLPSNTEIQNYTGSHVIVFFDANGLFASTNPFDSLQTIVNLRNVDSIRYNTYWTSPSITINGRECWIYQITMYEVGNVVYDRVAFAPYRGITYRQDIGQNEGFNSDIRFFHSVRLSNNPLPYFNHECLREMLSYYYVMRYRYINGTSQINKEYQKSNSCIRSEVRYNRNFKP